MSQRLVSSRTRQDSFDVRTSIPEQSRKKARPKISRSVQDLSPEQLEKKRKNDREAQKAIRERTRNEIDDLKKQVDALKEENSALKTTLMQVHGDVMPLPCFNGLLGAVSRPISPADKSGSPSASEVTSESLPTGRPRLESLRRQSQSSSLCEDTSGKADYLRRTCWKPSLE